MVFIGVVFAVLVALGLMMVVFWFTPENPPLTVFQSTVPLTLWSLCAAALALYTFSEGRGMLAQAAAPPLTDPALVARFDGVTTLVAGTVSAENATQDGELVAVAQSAIALSYEPPLLVDVGGVTLFVDDAGFAARNWPENATGQGELRVGDAVMMWGVPVLDEVTDELVGFTAVWVDAGSFEALQARNRWPGRVFLGVGIAMFVFGLFVVNRWLRTVPIPEGEAGDGTPGGAMPAEPGG